MKNPTNAKIEKIVRNICKKHNVKLIKERTEDGGWELTIDCVSDDVMNAVEAEIAKRLNPIILAL